MKLLLSLAFVGVSFLLNAQCNIDIQWTSNINGGNITFNNVSTGVPSNPAFAWLYDGQSSSMENPTFPYNAAATQVCFAITDIDSSACQDSICGPLYTDSCFLDISWTSVVAGGNITFTNTSTGMPLNPAFAWLYDGQGSSVENPTFPYNAAAADVCFAIYDIDNPMCEDSICGPAVDDSCDLDISWTSVVAGGNITFTNTSTGMPTNAAFAWLYDGQGSSVENPTFPYNAAATDVCFAIYDIDNPMCEDSICGPAIDDSCNLNITWTSVIAGGNITFTNTSTGTPSNAGFAWLYDGQGSSLENPTFPYNDSITEVCFAIYDIDNPSCEDSICGPLIMDSTAYIVDPIGSVNFSLYPNPASNELTIQLDQFQSQYEARIYDLTGREIQVLRIVENQAVIDISLLDQGGYLFYLIDLENPKKIHIEKFLKQ